MPRTQSLSHSTLDKPPRWLGTGTLKALDLAGPEHKFSNDWVAENAPLLNGHIKTCQINSDLRLHAVEGCDLLTCSSSTPTQAGLHIVIVLEGSVDVAFGSVPLQLSVPTAQHATGNPQACGAWVHTSQPDLFVRHWCQGKFERKLSLHVDPRLLTSLAHTTGYTHLQAILNQHLHVQTWRPSSRAVVLAEQIIHLLDHNSPNLLLQSRALEFLHEAIHAGNIEHASEKKTLSPPALDLNKHLRMAKLRTILDTQQDQGASIADLASEMGLSTSSLQRQFRQIYGMNIDEYRRSQRMKQARALLEQTGWSVLKVAHATGYTSAANFSTAFKRSFGISPKLVRAKL